MALGEAAECLECEENSTSLIARNLPNDIFTNDNTKTAFENLFKHFGDVSFVYLPGFQRIIINFTKINSMLLAKEMVHGQEFKGVSLKIYFKEEAKKVGEDFLKLPQAEKLFLISPPASPPVGWSQKEEPIPVVNYDLLTAVAGMEMPGKTVELIPRTDSTPSIVVMGCENPTSLNEKPLKNINCLPRKEVQTKRPPVKES